MTDPKNRSVSRRDFLKLTAAGVAAAGAGSVLAACGAPAPTDGPACPPAPTPCPTPAPHAVGQRLCWGGGGHTAPARSDW